MIKANELRIGNSVMFFGYHVVWGLQSNEAMLFTKKPSGTDDPFRIVSYQNIEPIPLTEEWLIKFGFEKKRGVSLYPFCMLFGA